MFKQFSYKWFSGLNNYYSYDFQFKRVIFYLAKSGYCNTNSDLFIFNTNKLVKNFTPFFVYSFFWFGHSNCKVSSNFFNNFYLFKFLTADFNRFNPYLFLVFRKSNFKLTKLNFNFQFAYNVTNLTYYDYVRNLNLVSRSFKFLSVNSYFFNFYNFNRKQVFFNDLISSLVVLDFRLIFQSFEPFFYSGDYVDTSDTPYPRLPGLFSRKFFDEHSFFFSPDFDEFADEHHSMLALEQLDWFVYDDAFMYRSQVRVFERVVYGALLPNSFSSFSKIHSFICSNSVNFINFFNSQNVIKINDKILSSAKFSIATYHIGADVIRRYGKFSNFSNNFDVSRYNIFLHSSKLFLIREVLTLIWELYYFTFDNFIFANNSLYFLTRKFPEKINDFTDVTEMINFFVTKSNFNFKSFNASSQVSLEKFSKLINKNFTSLTFKIINKIQLEFFLNLFLDILSNHLLRLNIKTIKDFYDSLVDYFKFMHAGGESSMILNDSVLQTEFLAYIFNSIRYSKKYYRSTIKTDPDLTTVNKFKKFKSKYFSSPEFDFVIKNDYDRFFNGEDFTFMDRPEYIFKQFDFFFRQVQLFDRFAAFELNIAALVDNFIYITRTDNDNTSFSVRKSANVQFINKDIIGKLPIFGPANNKILFMEFVKEITNFNYNFFFNVFAQLRIKIKWFKVNSSISGWSVDKFFRSFMYGYNMILHWLYKYYIIIYIFFIFFNFSIWLN